MSIHVADCLALSDLPRECIDDCTGPGPADEAVAFWRRKLDLTVDRRRAVLCLKGYGAWELADLCEKSDDDIAELVLWLACGDFHEFIVHCDAAGIDPAGDRPDDFDPPSGSDIFCLE